MPNAPFLAPDRDSAFKRGRAKRSGLTYYSIPGVVLLGTLDTSPAPVANADIYEPMYCDTPIVVDQLALNCSTLDATPANIRIGIYAADTDWQPVGAPLADSGSISLATTGVKTYTPGTPLSLPRGRYLKVFNCDKSDVAVFRFLRGTVPGGPIMDTIGTTAYVHQVWVTRTYAAFPTPGIAWNTVDNVGTPSYNHLVLLRISQP